MFDPPKDPWEIVPAGRALPDDRRFDLYDRTTLEGFLRRFKFEYKVMERMRDLLVQSDPAGRFDDDEVIETVAWRLATKELVVRDPTKRTIDTGGGGGGDQQSSQPPAPQIAATAPGPAPASEESEPNTFGAVNANAQAGALTSAAAQGSPFCQPCSS